MTAALCLTVAGVTTTPAHAIITKRFGSGFPTRAACDDVGVYEMRNQGAHDWTCYPQNGAWSGDLIWYT
ncbi:hypothetical protein BWI15_03985 [Kribbella sp. ALI-6-A]|nr:hypothetical protein BWI15_03985 [Kribbella sp. ALI-6-A]